MTSPITDYLEAVLRDCRNSDGGEVLTGNRILSEADPDVFSVAVVTVEGTVYCAGDVDSSFSIQSISKALTYALALADRGLDAVHRKIDVEPSGDAFNEISLERDTGRPRNALINAGAIAAHSLVEGRDVEHRVDRILALHSAFVGRDLSIDDDVFDAEMESSDRNLALAHMLASVKVLECDAHEVVTGYARQCSIDVTTPDLAMLAATMANGGVHPESGERVATSAVVRQVLSTMTTCGMYDGTGDWIANVGIPAKSGVSGAIIGVLPGQLGIAVHSPRLDDRGNSVRGVEVFERLSRDMDLHMMDIAPSGHSAVRRAREEDGRTVYELQGDIRFAGAENIMSRVLADLPDEPTRIGFELEPARAVNGAAVRLLGELIERLRGDGHDVEVDDPNGLM
ncbi:MULTISPECIES: glutaminase A [unclassified Rhodococcus (in: high G+C Gram-positive bacteria)]|uniref:glutaminase A n=1 Tax=unclassified Rhodococcus (in: high G+C Gram-positive bacteria) TaxID=192944 RepID=UPI0006FD4A28|nr:MULTISPECIES: glutaminase A [unclassified Rhodococcus (in: high G+C Gram-positive bacteria)]KQU36726.1 glutaminase [Rhodococcus sp. Leaf225]KQU49229.1 glutaminase [Rhodococcus sp. Leaf258]